ncbi:hypothetical protein K503DRAFT_806763 [Rhizopogon vinicolor AM-OR11-026]|uniref:Uncharacterized protein n=1 Tax=Rhizopogon vinicolor AM-OR11-026 TaxID=1314800 RepID=A0A1B7MDU2_9AGAM|nr:hypothetical protein K503DRAFT_806763 [Rhizopogon vinicolor AM-OR11-026]
MSISPSVLVCILMPTRIAVIVVTAQSVPLPESIVVFLVLLLSSPSLSMSPIIAIALPITIVLRPGRGTWRPENTPRGVCSIESMTQTATVDDIQRVTYPKRDAEWAWDTSASTLLPRS